MWVEYSATFRQFLGSIHSADIKRDELQKNLIALFDDPYEAVYIPAGRSILTLLSGQLNYIYSTMDDMQKRLLDACTRDYIERVMKLRPQFFGESLGCCRAPFPSAPDGAVGEVCPRANFRAGLK